MSVEIEGVGAKYSSVKFRMETSQGHRFFMVVNEHGIEFWSDESSSGGLYGEPIRKTVDDLLDWFGGEGAKKPFKTRKQVKPRKAPAKSESRMPKFIGQKP